MRGSHVTLHDAQHHAYHFVGQCSQLPGAFPCGLAPVQRR